MIKLKLIHLCNETGSEEEIGGTGIIIGVSEFAAGVDSVVTAAVHAPGVLAPAAEIEGGGITAAMDGGFVGGLGMGVAVINIGEIRAFIAAGDLADFLGRFAVESLDGFGEELDLSSESLLLAAPLGADVGEIFLAEVAELLLGEDIDARDVITDAVLQEEIARRVGDRCRHKTISFERICASG